MSGEVKMICVDCGETILWEQICGIRLVKEDKGKKTCQTQCGCGNVVRSPSGTKQ